MTFLGTGAGVPSKERNVTSIVLHLMNKENNMWLFDCGEATQHQILHSSVKITKINKIFITHTHGDHLYGLPGLLSSRSFQGATTPLTIYAPKGVSAFIESALSVSQTFLTYSLEVLEVNETGVLFNGEDAKVTVGTLDHGVLSLGFRVEQRDTPGSLLMDKVTKAGIPSGPHLKELKSAREVTLPDGRTVNGKEFIGPPQKGKSVTILGDTRHTKNLFPLASDVDTLVHESTFAKSEEALAQAYFHSTASQAAALAKEAGVRQLILTHISPRYQDSHILAEEARALFPNTYVASDFSTFLI
nr:ribonuclease Z [Alteribacter salitolerans]